MTSSTTDPHSPNLDSSPVIRRARRHAAARTDEYLYSQLIPYIGNKRKLLPLIDAAIERTNAADGVFADLFAGSGVVSRLAKRRGFRVVANDWEPYALDINRCFIGCNQPPPFTRLGGPGTVLELLNALPGAPGYIAGHLCPEDDGRPDTARERMFFTQANGARIDAIRERIREWEENGAIDEIERSYLLAPLVFAVSYVSNTSGVFKGFHNGWGGKTGTALYRILSDIILRRPILRDNGQENSAWQMDAQHAAERLRSERVRPAIAYLDPPYNQHPYGSNYHVLNTVVLWDKPAISPTISIGEKSAIRTDWRTERRSAYNRVSLATQAYGKLLETLDARFILTSYSTDGIIPLRDLIDLAAYRGKVSCVLNAYKRYRVSAQRMSLKPINVEFVLIVDTSRNSTREESDSVYEEILNAERAALAVHPETAVASEH